jgi:hypothetical protein
MEIQTSPVDLKKKVGRKPKTVKEKKARPSKSATKKPRESDIESSNIEDLHSQSIIQTRNQYRKSLSLSRSRESI